QACGGARILVNCAGATQPVPHQDMERLTDELFDRTVALNLRAHFSIVRRLAAQLGVDGDGVIVNVTSSGGLNGSGSSIAYCAAKAGLDTMTKSLARSLAPAIRVLAVAPGATRTDFVAGRDAAWYQAAAQASALKKVIEPDEIALAVLACITHL